MRVCKGFTGDSQQARWFFEKKIKQGERLRKDDRVFLAYSGPGIVGGMVIRGGKVVIIYPLKGKIHDLLVKSVRK